MEEIQKKLDFRENEIRSKYKQLVGEIQEDNSNPFAGPLKRVPLMESFIETDFKGYKDYFDSISKELDPETLKMFSSRVKAFGESFGLEIMYEL